MASVYLPKVFISVANFYGAGADQGARYALTKLDYGHMTSSIPRIW